MPLLPYSLQCDPNCGGGVDRLAILDKCDIETIAYAASGDGTVESITIKATAPTGGFQEVKLKSERVSFNQANPKNADNCGYAVNTTITTLVDCPANDYELFLAELKAKCCCGLVVALETCGNVILFGLDPSDDFSVGDSIRDQQREFTANCQETLTLTGKGRKRAKYLASGDFTTLPFAP